MNAQVNAQVAYNSVPVVEVQEVQEKKQSTVQATEPASTSPAFETNQEQAGSTELHPARSGRPKRQPRGPYQASPEAEQHLAAWEAHAPLRKSSKRKDCLKALDDLRRIDLLSWERITRICRWAVTEWLPKGMIGSPAALRTRTKKGDRMTWEALETQALAAEVSAKPVTPQPGGIVGDIYARSEARRKSQGESHEPSR